MKHYTYTLIDNKPHIVAENPHTILPGEENDPFYLAFNKVNQPILWTGPEFEGRKPESEIEFSWQQETNPTFGLQKVAIKVTKAARPKEVEQPVQHEDVYYCVKPSDIPCHKQCDSCKAVNSRIDNNPVQQSTPIASEGETIVKLKVVWDHMDRVFLMNERGDSYTSKSEELMDFILASESSQEKPQATVQKELSEKPKTAISDVIDMWDVLDEGEKALALAKFKSIMESKRSV